MGRAPTLGGRLKQLGRLVASSPTVVDGASLCKKHRTERLYSCGAGSRRRIGTTLSP